MKIGDKIYNLRKEKNLTQEQLSDVLNVSPAAISKWETSNSYPDIILLPKIAKVFDVSIDYLLDYVVTPRLKVEEALEQSLELSKNQKYLESIEVLKETLNRYPSSIELEFEIGKIYFIYASNLKVNEKKSMLTESKKFFLNVTKREGNNILKDWSYHYLTAISIINNDLEDAKKYNDYILLPENLNPINSKIAIKTKRQDKDVVNYILNSIEDNIKNYCLQVNWLTSNLIRSEDFDQLKEEIEKLIDIVKIYTQEKVTHFDVEISELYETLAYIKALEKDYESCVLHLNQSVDYILRYTSIKELIHQKSKLLSVLKSSERKIYNNLDNNEFNKILDRLK